MEHRYECVIKLELNPVRYASSKEEFIENLIDEYNNAYGGMFAISRSDISNIDSDNPEDDL